MEINAMRITHILFNIIVSNISLILSNILFVSLVIVLGSSIFSFENIGWSNSLLLLLGGLIFSNDRFLKKSMKDRTIPPTIIKNFPKILSPV